MDRLKRLRTGAPTLTTTAITSPAAGSYRDHRGQGTLAAANYCFTLVNGTLTITKVTWTYCQNASRVYGAANPTFTYAMAGFVNGDTQASATTGVPSLTTTATTSSADGTYPITGALGTLTSTSYTFVFVNATLTIDSTGTGTPSIQGRWEFAITSGDTPTQLSQMGQSTISSYVMQSGTVLSIISAFNANTLACDTNAGSNASLSGSTIDAYGNVIMNFTFTEPGSATFHVVFTGTLYSGTPAVITGTYQRMACVCTMGSLGSGTPDGNFTATYFPDISGTLNGAFEAPDTGVGTGSPATFVLTTNADKSLKKRNGHCGCTEKREFTSLLRRTCHSEGRDGPGNLSILRHRHRVIRHRCQRNFFVGKCLHDQSGQLCCCCGRRQSLKWKQWDNKRRH